MECEPVLVRSSDSLSCLFVPANQLYVREDAGFRGLSHVPVPRWYQTESPRRALRLLGLGREMVAGATPTILAVYVQVSASYTSL